MCKTVSVHLIKNEQEEHPDRGRIVSMLSPPKANDEPKFNDPVTEHIESRKVLAAQGNVLRSMKQMTENKVIRTLCQYRPRDKLHQVEQELGRN